MSLLIVRDAIVLKLQGLLPEAKIYGRERYAVLEEDFSSFYVTDDPENPIVFGGYVRRTSTKELLDSTDRNVDIHKWAIRLYRSFLDDDDPAKASETLFDMDIEAVRTAFRTDETLGDLIETSYVDGLAGIQLDDSGPVEFAGVLCHGARFTLQTQTSVSSAVEPDGDFNGFNTEIDPTNPDGASMIEAHVTFEED